MRTSPPQIKSARHHCQDSGSVNEFRGKISGIRDHDADGDFNRTVVNMVLHPMNDHAEQQPHSKSGNRQVGQSYGSGTDCRGLAGYDDRQTKLQGEQPSGVIEKAFAFQHVNHPLRQANSFGNGGRGNCIRRGYHRSQNHSQSPVKSGKSNMGRCRHADHRKTHQPESQK